MLANLTAAEITAIIGGLVTLVGAIGAAVVSVIMALHKVSVVQGQLTAMQDKVDEIHATLLGPIGKVDPPLTLNQLMG